MADLAVTKTQVQPGENAVFSSGIAGQTIIQGQNLYLEAETQTWKLADCNASVQMARTQATAISEAVAGQVVSLIIGGTIILGAAAAPVKGTIYVQSGTPGGWKPAADLASGDNVTLVGVGDGQLGVQTFYNFTDIALP